MSNKTIKVSSDGGTTYYTLPGNNGDLSTDLGMLDDTIFGQNFKSSQPNLLSWNVSANAFYKGYTGYSAVIKQTGTPTSMTAEAMSLVTGKTYKTTAATKNCWDPATAVTVYDNAVDKTAFVLNIDYVFGQVTFLSSYTVTGPVTVTGKYLPLTTMAKYNKYSLSITQADIDNTDIPTAQGNSGYKTVTYGLQSVGMEVSGVYASTNAYHTNLVARSLFVIELNPDGAGKSVARGFFKPSGRKQNGNQGALEVETAQFDLFVPTPITGTLYVPFRWEFTSSDLSTAVQKCITAWQANTTLKMDYSYDGATGFRGDVTVQDISLSGGLEAMNEFSVKLTGTGALTAY